MRPAPTPFSGRYTPGDDPDTDAWFTTFVLENHLDHFAYPREVATPEQVEFLVFLNDKERYFPCSEATFREIMSRAPSPYLSARYQQALDHILALIDTTIEEPNEKAYLTTLIKTKYAHETRDEIMIPSRVEKRLLRIFLNRTHIADPFQETKLRRNRTAAAFLDSCLFKQTFQRLEEAELAPARAMNQVRTRLDHVAVKRLLNMLTAPTIWAEKGPSMESEEALQALFHKTVTGDAAEAFFSFLGIPGSGENTSETHRRTLLWLANESGEVMIDLAIIRYLVSLGHKVIVSFKAGPLFSKAEIIGTQEDPALIQALEGSFFIRNDTLTKNQLVEILRQESNLLILSDGTHEKLNLLLTSTTFARLFKEVDCVVARGAEQKNRLFDTPFHFTQDIFSLCADEAGVTIDFKPKSSKAIKFSHKDLERKAQTIISEMRDAKNNGMAVSFYSGIIGSIPGKIDIAKKLMTVFIAHLEEQFSQTHIINPSLYYEPGMDADDLMFMWEIVQRSGYIDIWRFQTYQDIVTTFQLMGEKVPPEWVGKDATYSTGCTKEMKIAMEVQQRHPEMQIIGPATEKFMRRRDYGIGKMYDQRLGNDLHTAHD
ncbi:ARMT1-like domain-containing protein [Desulfoluna sp.]|uniref:ARMT1-like domain-containing protein n=1 Tax=Desulfoluna sp. TaxID=2045199 RepID=UPI0026380E22|nr:ARMT1-like domain-containing protein [Desulfoluna sp.]